ncbi:hypothetical protein CBL_03470 [Carabus blaptoides fortunei]
MARLFLQVILLVAFVAVLDCAPASPPSSSPGRVQADDTPQPKDHDGIPKPRAGRSAQQNVPAKPNPLQTVPEARATDPTTTVRTRPARAADHEGKPHEDNPVIHGTQLDGNARSNEGRSTTPKSRPARAADHEGKPHDEINPLAASSLAGKAAENHDDHGHSTTPKSRPARASGVPEKSGDAQDHPAQAVPLAKLGNTEQNPSPKSRPARATPNEESRASHVGAQLHADVKEGAEKAEDKIKESLPERKTRDTEVKKDESAGKDGAAQTRPLLRAHERPANLPGAAHNDRQRRDDAKAAARQPDAPLKASQPDSHSGPAVPLIGLAKPENTARHTRDTGSSTLPPFKGIHGPTQGDLENIRRAKEEREKLDKQ